VAGKKTHRAVAAREVPQDDARIRDLVRDLPRGADKKKFAESVREAASCFSREREILSNDEIRSEIRKFRDAANFKRPKTNRTSGVKYEKVARLRESLSVQTVEFLNKRAARINRPVVLSPQRAEVIGRNGQVVTRKGGVPFEITLPTADELRDPERRESACENIILLCSNGSDDLYAPRVLYVEQPNGRAPIRKRRPKRKAELDLVGRIRLAWLEAAGASPAPSAKYPQLGPFARVVAKCLELVGAYSVGKSAGEGGARLINEWGCRRRKAREDLLRPKRPGAVWRRPVRDRLFAFFLK
jgi:hypothetical protein